MIDLAALQRYWDAHLMMMVMSHPDVPMWRLHRDFLDEHKIDYEAFQQLKRVPRLHYHFGCNVVRFIAGYLPLLSRVLWNRQMSLTLLQFDKIVSTLQRSKIDTDITDQCSAYKADQKEIRAGAKQERRTKIVQQVNNVHWDRNKLSGQWSVCK